MKTFISSFQSDFFHASICALHFFFLRTKLQRQKQEQSEFKKEIYISNLENLYQPLFPDLRVFRDEYLSSEFREAITKKHKLQNIVKKESPYTPLYSLNIFTPEFLELLYQELRHAETFTHISWHRPNSMNNEGFLLKQLGFEQFLEVFMHKWIIPLAGSLFPEWNGYEIDSVHAFTVKYTGDGDTILDKHLDQSSITLNTHIKGDHQGSVVKFQGIQHDQKSLAQEDIDIMQRQGVSLLHVGQHWHEATPLTAGERYNLIFWFRSTNSMSNAYEKFMTSCVPMKEEL